MTLFFRDHIPDRGKYNTGSWSLLGTLQPKCQSKMRENKMLKMGQTLSRTKKFAHFYEVYHDTA